MGIGVIYCSSCWKEANNCTCGKSFFSSMHLHNLLKKQQEKHNESFSDLIREAKEVLLDRNEDERILIHSVAQMPEIERLAIIAAYELMWESEHESENP